MSIYASIHRSPDSTCVVASYVNTQTFRYESRDDFTRWIDADKWLQQVVPGFYLVTHAEVYEAAYKMPALRP